MAEFLFKVAEVFEIPERGLIIATDTPIREIPFVLRPGEVIEFRSPDGGKFKSTIRALEFASPFNPNRTFAFLAGAEVAKVDIPPGTQIWLVSRQIPQGPAL